MKPSQFALMSILISFIAVLISFNAILHEPASAAAGHGEDHGEHAAAPAGHGDGGTSAKEIRKTVRNLVAKHRSDLDQRIDEVEARFERELAVQRSLEELNALTGSLDTADREMARELLDELASVLAGADPAIAVGAIEEAVAEVHETAEVAEAEVVEAVEEVAEEAIEEVAEEVAEEAVHVEAATEVTEPVAVEEEPAAHAPEGHAPEGHAPEGHATEGHATESHDEHGAAAGHH